MNIASSLSSLSCETLHSLTGGRLPAGETCEWLDLDYYSTDSFDLVLMLFSGLNQTEQVLKEANRASAKP